MNSKKRPKSHRSKWDEYNRRKALIADTAKDSEEYTRMIRQLIKELRL